MPGRQPFLNLGKLSQTHRRLMVLLGNNYVGLNAVVRRAIVFQNDNDTKVYPEVTWSDDLAAGDADVYNPVVEDAPTPLIVWLGEPITGLQSIGDNISLPEQIETQFEITTITSLNKDDKLTITYPDNSEITVRITEQLASHSFSQTTYVYKAVLV